MVPVPDRLEQPVGKAQDQNVLHRFLPEIMIDPVDLMLGEAFEQPLVEAARRGEIGAERLLDDDAPPGAVRLACKPGLAEPGADRSERRRGCCEIEQTVACGVKRMLDARELSTEPLVGLAAFCFARQIGDAREQLGSDRTVHRVGGELTQARFQMFSEGLGRKVRTPHADDAECLRQQTCRGEVVEGGDEQASGEVAGGPENHEAARIRRPRLACRRLRCHGCATLCWTSGSMWALLLRSCTTA